MRIAIFSDIHGNLPAFERMLKDAGPVDQYISLGDVVDYGPWSDECVELLEGLRPCIKLIGNHEVAFMKNQIPGHGELMKSFFHFCRARFSRFADIKKYKKQYSLGKYRLAHTFDNQYIFPDTNLTLQRDWIIGHSHHQFILRSNRHILMNPGSVGQNRQDINLINYAIFDTERDEFDLRKLSYNVDLVINEMKAKKYPQQCIAYYSTRKDRLLI